jgi:hypothetical protein
MWKWPAVSKQRAHIFSSTSTSTCTHKRSKQNRTEFPFVAYIVTLEQTGQACRLKWNLRIDWSIVVNLQNYAHFSLIERFPGEISPSK